MSPCCAVPVIAGSAVLTGAGGGGAATVVAAEVAGVDPPALVAVTITSIVWPTSQDGERVAGRWRRVMFVQLPERCSPAIGSCSRWAVRPGSVGGGQRVALLRGAADRRGAVLTGAGGGGSGTREVAAELAVVDPPALLAVTTTRSCGSHRRRRPCSCSTWRPLMLEHDPPELLQSCHW